MSVTEVIRRLAINALIYDCEIRNAIPDKDGVMLAGVNYCKGWGDHAGMGISVITAYDYAEQRYRVFLKDGFAEFADLCNQRQLLVGFNNISFDNPLLAACNVTRIVRDKCYDIMEEIWNTLRRRVKGYKLDDVYYVNYGSRKSITGDKAPVLWQKGQYGAVIDYCLDDVRRTKQVFDLVLEGKLLCPLTKQVLNLTRPILHVIDTAGSAQQGAGSQGPAGNPLGAAASAAAGQARAAGPVAAAGPASAATPQG